jgi:hypothetical protein
LFITLRECVRIAARLSISLASPTPVIVGALNVNGSGQGNLRRSRVSLTVEHIEVVAESQLQPTTQLSNLIEAYRCTKRRVRTSQVNHELLVQIYPHVIISQESERLSSIIGKVTVNRQAKPKVVVIRTIVPLIVPSAAIDREEKEVGEIEDVLGLGNHANVVRNSYGLIVLRKPISEAFRASNRPMGARTRVNIVGKAICPK